MELAAQVLAAVEDKRIFAVSVTKEAGFGITFVVLIRWQHRIEDGAVDPRRAILVRKALVGVHDANAVSEPLLGVDEGATDGLKVLAWADGDQLTAHFLDCGLNPVFIPVVGLDKRTQLLGGKVFDAVNPRRVLKIRGERRDEYVLIQVKCADDGVGPLWTVHRNGSLTCLAQLAEHLAGFALGALVLLNKNVFQIVSCALVLDQGNNIDGRKLLLQVLQANTDHHFLFPLLPELTHDGDAFLIHEIGAHLNLTLNFGDLRLDHPTHKVTDKLTTRTVFRTNGNSGKIGPLKRHAFHGNLLVDDVINEEYTQIAGAVPRRGRYFAAFTGMLLAVSGLTVPNSVTGLVVQPALINKRLVITHAILKGFLQQVEARSLVFSRCQLQAWV